MSVCIINGLLKSGKAKSVSLAITCFISMNEFYSTTVHFYVLLTDVRAVSGASISDLLGHISL